MTNSNIIRNCLIETLVLLCVNTWIGKRYSTCSKDEKIWRFVVKYATRRLKLAFWYIPFLTVIRRQNCAVEETFVLVCYKIFVFPNGNVPGLKHTDLILTGYRQLSHGLRRPLHEANQPNHLLLKLRLSGVKILLLHVT